MGWNDLIGRQLGSYTIIDELGRGGSSRVYRGRDGDTQRDVAIKVIPNDAEDRVGFVRRFEREVQAVAQLNHPNIVAVYDRGETEDLVYLVMQCVTGGTLRLRLGRPLSLGAAAALIIQMALALHHAHLHGIIHRDVKPSNMLLDSTNPHYLLLTDFGIAKLQGMRGLTKTGTTIGTPEYMSPEQAEGKEIDPRADVYSLGCVLYEALAGRPPFTGSTPVSVLYQQVHSRPAYIRGFNPDVPRELVRVLEQALAKRPEDRFGTADGLAQALYPFADESLPTFLPRPATGALHLPPTPPSLPVERMSPPTPPVALPLPQTPPQSDALRASNQAQQWDGAVGASPDSGVQVFRSPDSGRLMPPISTDGLGEVAPPAPQRGLGAEGLDAIFPDDPEAQSVRNTYQATQRSRASGKLGSRSAPSGPSGASTTRGVPDMPGSPSMPNIPGAPGLAGTPATPNYSGLPGLSGSPGMPVMPGMPEVQGIAGGTSGPLGGEGQPGQPGQSSRPRGASGSQTIPLPAFRLPAKKTQPLNLPLTADGRLDMEALMSQVEAPRPPSSPLAPPPPVTRYESTSGPARTWQREQTPPSSGYSNSGSPAYKPGGSYGTGAHDPLSRMPDGGGWESYGMGAEQQWQDEAPGQAAGRPDTSVSAFRRAYVATSELHAVEPVWRPQPAEQDSAPRARLRRPLPRRVGRGPLIAGIAVAALLLVSLVAWVGLSASGVLTLARGSGHSTPIVKATATSTPVPTATATQSATATSTTNPQAALDRQAAASFRAVTLATYNDGSCGTNVMHFGSGEAIFVNLCASNSATSGPMNVTIRQGGQVLYTMVNGQYISAGSHYWYSRYGLPSGTYDMLVTLQINGRNATARDIQFTVG
ncbi:MAG TPA: protein kinase [Ktedonobacterales bacterium]